jgi:hypothetical protein
MDATWLQAVASKDSLFATDWPLWPWLLNLGLVAVIVLIEWVRTARGAATPESRALVWGTLALTAVFLLTLPLVAARYALPVQLQISRVFWPTDFVAALFIVGELVDRNARRALVGLVAIALIAIGRGTYVLRFERVVRPLVAISLPDTPWEQAMAWIRTQPANAHVLADPGHTWKYGTSVRVSGQRDVFLEEVKDAAIAIYSHDVAVRVVERSAALGDFSTLDAERARALASRYHLDLLVTEATLPLPLAYSNRQFHIYRLS